MDSLILQKRKRQFIYGSLFLILFMTIVVTATMGTANIKVLESLKIVIHQIPLLGDIVDISAVQKNYVVIIQSVRLPRIMLSVLVGIGLSISGVTFQGMLKNPMADPFIIGISSGAALGATIGIVLRLQWAILGISSISIFAFFGALGTTFLVYNLARIKAKVPVTTLLLAGIAVGQFLTAIMSFMMVAFSGDMHRIIFWTLGSFSTKSWTQVKMIFIPVLLGWGLLRFYAKDLNAMLLGEESAQHLGIEVERIKKILLALNAFIVAMVVSVSGIIGFVGLIIPHIVRLMVGPDHRILIPAAGLVGGIFMLMADTIARIIIAPMEIPVGIITALFGGPFFIFLLRRKKNSLL